MKAPEAMLDDGEWVGDVLELCTAARMLATGDLES